MPMTLRYQWRRIKIVFATTNLFNREEKFRNFLGRFVDDLFSGLSPGKQREIERTETGEAQLYGKLH